MTFQSFSTMEALDFSSMLFCLLCWIGYTLYSDHWGANKPSLMSAMRENRLRWMRTMAKRDNRIVDATIVSLTIRAVALFASTSIIIVGGLIALIGSADEARSVASTLSFLSQVAIESWEYHGLALVMVFTYAFFKFVWSIRQFNHGAVLIGATPLAGEGDPENFAVRAAELLTLAFRSYNRGVRAYYFGLALSSGIIHPLLLIVVTLLVVYILHRREYRSNTFQVVARTSEQSRIG